MTPPDIKAIRDAADLAERDGITVVLTPKTTYAILAELESKQPHGFVCDGCAYRGREYEHLRGVNGIAHWVQCNYPTPFYVTPSATPLVGGTCNTRIPIQSALSACQVCNGAGTIDAGCVHQPTTMPCPTCGGLGRTGKHQR